MFKKLIQLLSFFKRYKISEDNLENCNLDTSKECNLEFSSLQFASEEDCKEIRKEKINEKSSIDKLGDKLESYGINGISRQVLNERPSVKCTEYEEEHSKREELLKKLKNNPEKTNNEKVMHALLIGGIILNVEREGYMQFAMPNDFYLNNSQIIREISRLRKEHTITTSKTKGITTYSLTKLYGNRK